MATKYWYGEYDGDWDNGNNWEYGGGGSIPANGDDVEMYGPVTYKCDTAPTSGVTLASFYGTEDGWDFSAGAPDLSNVNVTGDVTVSGDEWYIYGPWTFGTIGGTFTLDIGYSGSTGGACTSANAGYLYGAGEQSFVGGTYGSMICDGNGCTLYDCTITNNLSFINSCALYNSSGMTIGGVLTIGAGSEVDVGDDFSGASSCKLYGAFYGGSLPSPTNAYAGATIFSNYGGITTGAIINVYGNIYFGSGYGTYGMTDVNIYTPRCVITQYWEGAEWDDNYFPSVFGIA